MKQFKSNKALEVRYYFMFYRYFIVLETQTCQFLRVDFKNYEIGLLYLRMLGGWGRNTVKQDKVYLLHFETLTFQ